MEARYTQTLYDLRKTDPNFFDFIDFIDSDHSAELVSAIKAMWDIYEIAGETPGEQHKFMLDTFNEFKPYYVEKITEYDKKLDWINFHISTIGVEGTDTNLHSELPNKQISADDYFAYPTDTNKDNTNSTTTATDPSKLMSLRRQYLSQIKDYYREFALRFSQDFIHMF